MGQGAAASGTHEVTYLLRQPLHARWRDPQTTLAMRGNAEPEELALPGPRHRAFLRIDAQLQDFLEEDPDPTHHPVPRHATAYVDVAVIGVAAKRELPSFQFMVQIVEQDVGKERRKWAALRRALGARLDQPITHHSGFQEPSDQLQHSYIADLPRHPRHQHVMVD